MGDLIEPAFGGEQPAAVLANPDVRAAAMRYLLLHERLPSQAAKEDAAHLLTSMTDEMARWWGLA